MAELAVGNLTVRAMQPADAPAVARLHQSQIAAGFLSSLGPRVLTSIYRALPRTRAGFGFVAERDGEIVGFITCATNLKRLYRGILWRKGLILSWRLMRYVFSLGILRKIIQTIFYPGKVERLDVPSAEVLSVVTSPQARGLGIASKLMSRAFAEFIRQGCDRVKVLVGANLVPANAYYLKNGFVLAGTLKHHDEPENIYVATLDRPATVTSDAAALRNAYVQTGRLPVGRMICLALRDLFIIPFWWPVKMMPGAVPMKLRQWVYRVRLSAMGRHSLIDLAVEISRGRNVRIGDFTLIDKYCQLTAPSGSIAIGSRCHLAPFTIVLGHGGVTIEDYVGIGAGARIVSISEWPGGGKRLAGPMVPEAERGLKIAPVRLCCDSFVGANAVVLPGVTVGEGAVVGAGSVVGRDVPPWTIVMGVPAMPVGHREPIGVLAAEAQA